MSPEVWLAAGYAGFLALVAVGLEWLARHTAARSERYRTAGFRYHPEHDLWVCPEDQQLWPHEFDPQRRVVRYRAKAIVCNACPTKHRCTDSEEGREIARAVDPWPHSEAGRFHRGVSLLLLVLAALFLVVEMARHHAPLELLLTGPLLLGVAALGFRYGDELRRTPANFPEPTPGHGLRVAAPGRNAFGAGRSVQTTGIPASRSRWASDRGGAG